MVVIREVLPERIEDRGLSEKGVLLTGSYPKFLMAESMINLLSAPLLKITSKETERQHN